MPAWKFESAICEAEQFKCPSIEKEYSIALKLKAHKQIKAMLEKYKEQSLEWIAGLEGAFVEADSQYVIERIVLYPQEVSGGFCEFTPDGVLQMSNNPNLLGTIHSHHSMPANFSTVDVENNKQYKCCLVINNTFNYDSSIKAKTDCGKEFMAKAKHLYVPKETYNDEILTVAENIVKEKVYENCSLNPDHNNSVQTTVIGQVRTKEIQVCHICNFPLKVGHKSKICNACGMEVHSHCFKETSKKCKNCHEYSLAGEEEEDYGCLTNPRNISRRFGMLEDFC